MLWKRSTTASGKGDGPEFHKEHKKLTGEKPTPLMPEDHEKESEKFPASLKSSDRVVREIHRRRSAFAALTAAGEMMRSHILPNLLRPTRT
jgi:hypothetical protein